MNKLGLCAIIATLLTSCNKPIQTPEYRAKDDKNWEVFVSYETVAFTKDTFLFVRPKLKDPGQRMHTAVYINEGKGFFHKGSDRDVDEKRIAGYSMERKGHEKEFEKFDSTYNRYMNFITEQMKKGLTENLIYSRK